MSKQAITLNIDFERIREDGTKEPFDVELKWSDFSGASTTVFEAAVVAQKQSLSYLSASYGYGSGWAISSVGGWGPGEGHVWDVYVDKRKVSGNWELERIALTKEAGNSLIEFRRVKQTS